MLKSLLLVIAVCIDSFAAAIGIGSAGIRIPIRSALVISVVGSLFLSLSAAFASVLRLAVSEKVCTRLSFFLLMGLGIFNLFQNFFRNILSRSAKKGNPAMMFFDGASADTDGSKSISVKEALVLSAALSADSLVTGIGAGLDSISLPALSIFAFGLGFASIFCGEKIGRKIVSSFKLNLGWLCGTILIILAVLTLV